MMKRTLPAVLQMTNSNCNRRSSTPASLNSLNGGVANENFALLTLHKQQQQQQQIGSFRSTPPELMHHHHQSTMGRYQPAINGNGSGRHGNNESLMMMTAMQQHNNLLPESSL